MNLQENIRRVLREETQGATPVAIIINSLYPNFNRDNAVIQYKSSNAGRNVIVYDDPETDYFFCSYWVDERDLSLNEELFETLENYLGEEGMLYVIEWFNNEFNQQAKYLGI
jgi:hypothetical protein